MGLPTARRGETGGTDHILRSIARPPHTVIHAAGPVEHQGETVPFARAVRRRISIFERDAGATTECSGTAAATAVIGKFVFVNFAREH